MITSQQIAKEIDLKRFLSIVEDFPKIEKRTAYNFDLPLTVEAKSSCLKYCSKFALCLMAIAFSLC